MLAPKVEHNYEEISDVKHEEWNATVGEFEEKDVQSPPISAALNQKSAGENCRVIIVCGLGVHFRTPKLAHWDAEPKRNRDTRECCWQPHGTNTEGANSSNCTVYKKLITNRCNCAVKIRLILDRRKTLVGSCWTLPPLCNGEIIAKKFILVSLVSWYRNHFRLFPKILDCFSVGLGTSEIGNACVFDEKKE